MTATENLKKRKRYKTGREPTKAAKARATAATQVNNIDAATGGHERPASTRDNIINQSVYFIPGLFGAPQIVSNAVLLTNSPKHAIF